MVGAVVFYLYEHRSDPRAVDARRATPPPAEWRLHPDEIKRDLEQKGEVVRAKTRQASEKIADARITAMVKAKYVLDRDLSALDISVDTQDGNVTLTGQVASPDLVARATELALDTEGVRNVTARLRVK